MKNIDYYLILEKRPGDYNIVDINRINTRGFFIINDLGAIDSFTSKYTINELRNLIVSNNIVTDSYFDGVFKIISSANHRFDVIDKNLFNAVINFQNSNDFDKNLKNKLFGWYKSAIDHLYNDKEKEELLNNFNMLVKSENKIEIFKEIEKLPYFNSRQIYLKIGNYFVKDKNTTLAV